MQTGNNVRVLYKVEPSFGTVPGALTGAKQLRITSGGGLRFARARIDSRELRADGQTGMTRLGSRSVAGGYGVQISAGEADDLFEALFRGTWTGDVLVPGSTARSFHFEEQHLDIDVSKVYTGVRVGSARVSLQPDGIATVEFGLVGADRDLLEGASAPFFTAPYTVTTSDPMTSTEASISVDAVPVLDFTSCEFTIDRRASAQPVIGSDTTPDVFTNNMTVEGSISALRADAARESEFLAETVSTLVITLAAPTGTASYTFTFNLKFVDYSDNLGEDNAMVATLPFVAGVDAGAANMLTIARTT